MDYCKFVYELIRKNNLELINISEEYMNAHLNEIMEFINGISIEYNEQYGWEEQEKEYFLNPLIDKFKYSYLLRNKETNKIVFTSISSVYEDHLHLHSFYCDKNFRNIDLGKLVMIHFLQKGLNDGFKEYSCYSHKHNSMAIIFYLKSGWKIEGIRNNKEVYFQCYSENVIENVHNQLRKPSNIN